MFRTVSEIRAGNGRSFIAENASASSNEGHARSERRREALVANAKDFSDFWDEVLEWGVDHAAGVDFDDPELDFDALDNAIASIGLPPSECL